MVVIHASCAAHMLVCRAGGMWTSCRRHRLFIFLLFFSNMSTENMKRKESPVCYAEMKRQ